MGPGSTLTSQCICSDSGILSCRVGFLPSVSESVACDLTREPCCCCCSCQLGFGVSEGAEASASVSSVVLGFLLGTQDGSHSCCVECYHRCCFFEYIDLLVSLLHFFFGFVGVIIENPRHPMLSLYRQEYVQNCNGRDMISSFTI